MFVGGFWLFSCSTFCERYRDAIMVDVKIDVVQWSLGLAQ